MNSSNSFNICPRCGNSNSLNAKYCARCGVQLKVPTEAVVCHKCHTRNSALANFCRNCGATLKVGAQTKICPRCGREIGAEENMCACGYSFVTMQQTEPKRADVSSTYKENKKDKKHGKGKQSEQNYADASTSEKESKPKKKKGGRGFALVAFIFLAVFVVAILLPANTRGSLVDIDKGFYHPVSQEEAQASLNSSSTLYADEAGEDNQTAEQWSVTFKNGDETVSTVQVDKGQKLTAEQIPTAPEAPQGAEFKGWFNGETAITTDTEITSDVTATAKFETATTTPAKDLENNIYGWDFINDLIALFGDETKAAMEGYEGGAFNYIVKEYFGPSAFMLVAIFAVFILTALFHLLVCVVRIIAPNRSKRPNYLYLALGLITAILVALMAFSSKLPGGDESAFKAFFLPAYKGMTCEYGLMIWAIPAYYIFFFVYSLLAKKKTVKKDKSAKK